MNSNCAVDNCPEKPIVVYKTKVQLFDTEHIMTVRLCAMHKDIFHTIGKKYSVYLSSSKRVEK